LLNLHFLKTSFLSKTWSPSEDTREVEVMLGLFNI